MFRSRLPALPVLTAAAFISTAALPQELATLPQELATLIADTLSVSADNTLIAEGDVEVFYGETSLIASRITYDQKTGSLKVEGPIQLSDPQGRTVILASSAQLDADLQNGILRSARLILDQKLQLAATEISRVDGRYTQLYKTVASACKVCANRPVPLWEIRSDKVIHDTLERQLYFEGAQMRVMGVPVLYLPRLRMPDPTLKRSRGFLIPQLKSSSTLSTGIKIPYFQPLGDSADLTFTPYISAQTRTLELRYRQAFINGDIQFEGAYSNDDLVDTSRAYVFGTGNFGYQNGNQLNFNIALTSDDTYLLDYGYSGNDRLSNSVALTRTRDDQYFSAQLETIRTLRDSDQGSSDELAYLIGQADYEKRFEPGLIGGQAGYRFSFQGLGRLSQDDEVGRDSLRFGAGLDWERDWIFNTGLVLTASAQIDAANYSINQDSNFDTNQSVVNGVGAVQLAWPWAKSTPTGVSHIITPVVQLAWNGQAGPDGPDEDSVFVEFDEGNLFALSRFPGGDRFEDGARATFGGSWNRYDPAGWSLGVTLGRVYYQDDSSSFFNASGLDGTQSDWLVAGQVEFGNGSRLSSRNLVADDFSLTKSETRFDWASDPFGLASTYTYLVADADEERDDDASELTLDVAWNFSSYWTSTADWRYDFVAGRAASASIAAEFRNECATVNFSLSRRFTSSTSLEPTTDFGITVSLAGFGGSGEAAPRKRCDN
ncbi:LPS-assembly protein LptD [Candidatus Halocynthiibacter alkanivorans]|uniref:LPS-assembly protein LptD n=1 Tax=Candidatus Halocynthiibacter alkanivorans TaxID=2267619 RepID=UPI000DF29A67|nr:LPS assembly protein LptD [Candidatus Halocynthiibacter alkanivorans]